MRTILLSTVAAFAVALATPSSAQEAAGQNKLPVPQAASGGSADANKPGDAGSAGSAAPKIPQAGSGPSADNVKTGPSKESTSANASANGSETRKSVTETAGEQTGSSPGPTRGQAAERLPASQEKDTSKTNGSDATKKTTASEGGEKGKPGHRSAEKDGDADKKTSTSTSASEKTGDGGLSQQKTQSSGAARQSGSESTAAGQSTPAETGTSEASRSSTGTDQKSSASKQGQNSRASTTGSTSVELSREERTRVVRSFTAREIKPVENVRFSVSVGVSIPSDLELHPVPADVVEIVPAYRDYRYVVVEDQIVIVHPKTRKIVEVIEQGSTTASISNSKQSASLSLSREEETTVIKTLRSDVSAVFHEGATVPQCVELRPVPTTVDVPELRSYRYLVAGDSVILVEPSSRRVVKILE